MNRAKNIRRQLLNKRFLLCLTGGLLLFVCILLIAIDAASPGFIPALITRTYYHHETRLTDASQYRYTVEITSPTKADPTRWRYWSIGTAFDSAKDELSNMARRTSSNMVVMNRRGDILAEAYFARLGADPMMLTNSMSMAKTLVGLLIGIALDRGVIQSVDQPIGHFLKELEHDVRGRITIRNLLQMKSGLASQDSGFPLSHLQSMYFGDSPDARALSVPALGKPGELFAYNSVDTQLLLIVLERTMGAEFEELLSQHIWRPLALDPGFLWRGSNDGDSKGFCCVFATARSWAEIGRLFLTPSDAQIGDTSVVSTTWIQEMITPAEQPLNYGYQIWLGEVSSDQTRYVALKGSPQQVVIAIPALGIVAVRVGAETRHFSVDDFVSVATSFH